MTNVINQVIMLTIIMGVGFYSRKKAFINKEVSKGLSDILMNVTLPMLIISSFNFDYSKELANNIKWMVAYSILAHVILIIMSKLFFCKFNKNKRSILRFICIFSNYGFMGYPILESLYGKVSIFYASIYGIAFNVFSLSYGIVLLTGKKDSDAFKNVITHPGIISVFIGLILFLFSIKLPICIGKAINIVGDMTVPLSMIIIGAMLADANFKEVFSDFSLYYLCMVRLIVIPFLTLLLLKTLNINKLILNILVILQAMPGAAITGVFAEKYNADTVLASKAVFITTLFSIITIPLIATILSVI
ncbi:putative transporter YfdV [Clostridium acetireducens DSM 10703]|uniref:Putative transporter YfdV n=1 Tax=Clostridium acetireducens DSM 10703 TaxID=1121290 RepID=A0A1E8EX73_9CLOT|nr:AEC family transporter [Clostridium acetireducens]OFI05365.1 putative transporter YfdV [Clostridium acetireducens DSM 10703]